MRPLYLSARADDAGGYRVSGFAADGVRFLDLPLPGRGHSFAVRPDGRAAVHFARRPGRFALVLDLAQGAIEQGVETPGGRHFYGHGVFGQDGRLLYATENDFDGERGVIGVYDADSGYERVGEFMSHGIGPHEIALLSDGQTLVVANGGIATHPDLPRVKLNLPIMAPSLCHIDRQSGTLLQELTLDPALHRLSIRHLAVGPADTVAVAMQYEGPAHHRVPLVGLQRSGGALHLLRGPPAVLRAMKNYCGSVCFDASGGDHRRLRAARRPRDLLGRRRGPLPVVRRGPGRLRRRTGRAAERVPGQQRTGGVVVIDARSGKARPFSVSRLQNGRWDNHLVAVSAT